MEPDSELDDPELLDPELELPDELEDDPELLDPELELPDELEPELAPEPEPVSELTLELGLVVATLDPLLLMVVLFPSPSPASSFAPILDKSENIGFSLLVIPYAVTAAAIHNTIIIDMIIFALSNFFPPRFYILNIII